MNKLTKTVKISDLSREFIKSFNGLLGLTEREVELLSLIVDVNLGIIKVRITPEGIDTASFRKFYSKSTGITLDNMSRYFAKFRRKGILVKATDGSYSLNKALIPIVIGGRTVQLTMILNIKKDEI